MRRSLLRRGGAVFLFLLWAQVATANALPCGIACLMGKDVEQHHHDGGIEESHPIGHHLGGSKISAPEFCGTPQLMVAVFVPPDFPLPPAIEVPIMSVPQPVPVVFHSAVQEFATPPPRA